MKTSYSTQKDAHSIDWNPADIESAVKKRFGSYAALARVWSARNPDKPVGRHTLVKSAKQRQSALGEAVISWAVGIPAAQIWPSRYDSQGVRKYLRGASKAESSVNIRHHDRKTELFNDVLGLDASIESGEAHG